MTRPFEAACDRIGYILTHMAGRLDESLRIQMATQHIAAYALAAAGQSVKIREAVHGVLSSAAGALEPPNPSAALPAAHFYFTCWHAVREHLEATRQNGYGFRTPRQIWKKHHAIMEHYTAARDHCAHLGERLPRGKHSDWKGDPQNSMSGSFPLVRRDLVFWLHGKEWDVSPTSAAVLNGIIHEIIEGFLQEAEDQYQAFLAR